MMSMNNLIVEQKLKPKKKIKEKDIFENKECPKNKGSKCKCKMKKNKKIIKKNVNKEKK